MAKHLYEKERIDDIANKIRELAPGLREGLFTTAEMPKGIERVFEEGERKGQNEGFGNGFNSGYSSGLLRGKEEGYKDGHNKGHTEGFQEGYIDGVVAFKMAEARTESDVSIEGPLVTVPSGYYANTIEKEINQGVELPELTNPGTAEDLLAGKELIDGEGNIVKGTIPVVQMGIVWQATRHAFYSSDNVPYISTITEIDKPVYMSPSTGPIISVNAPASNYGNAPTNKVVKGYTFTSEAGLKVEGEIEDGNEVRY